MAEPLLAKDSDGRRTANASTESNATSTSFDSTQTAIYKGQHSASPSASQTPGSPHVAQPASPRLPFLPIAGSQATRKTSRPPAIGVGVVGGSSNEPATALRSASAARPPNPRSVSTSNRLSIARPPTRSRAKSKSKRSLYADSAAGTSDGGEEDLFSDGASDLAQNVGSIDTGIENDEDDEVAPLDRGEELVRRRMRERKREKKRLAALAAQQNTQQTRRASSRPAAERPISNYANASVVDDFDTSENGNIRDASGYSTASAIQTPLRPDFSRQSTAQNISTHPTEGSYFSAGRLSHNETASAPMSPQIPIHSIGPSADSGIRRINNADAGRRVSYALSNAPAQPFDNDQEDAQTSTTMSQSGEGQKVEDESDTDTERALLRGGRFGEHDDSDEEENNSDVDVEYTLKDRQDAINIEHPFGLPIWKPALYKKSRSVHRNAEREMHLTPSSAAERHLLPGNLLWTLLFGSWLAVVAFVLSAILWCVPWGGSKYGRVVFELGLYLFWPFGRYVEGFDIANLPTIDDAKDNEEAGDGAYDDSDGESFDVEAAGRTWSRNSRNSRPSIQSSDQATERPDRSFSHTPTAARTAVNVALTSDANATEHTSLLQSDGVKATDYGAAVSTSGSSTAVELENSPKGKATPIKEDDEEHESEMQALAADYNDNFRVRALGRLSYWVAYYFILAPLMLSVCVLCWGLVFSVPMAKLLWALVRYLGKEPLVLHFRSEPKYHPPADSTDVKPPPLKAGQLAPKHSPKVYAADRGAGRLVGPRAQILLCTYKAFGVQYYKYTIDGVNIMFINLLPLVFFVIFDFFFLHSKFAHAGGFLGFIAGQSTIFALALLSVIPLSYFIGMAVASISAQSSIGMGAVINATFGSIIEVILYSIALTQGKADLVEGSIVGSLLAGVLLMPGFSMLSGAIRRKEQKFNAKSAGVTSTMLIMAIIGTLTPTLFYEIYGTFQLTCNGCPPGQAGESWKCTRCVYQHIDPVDDPFYKSTVQYLSYTCAVCLVLSYLVGLWFSLRTHASQIWQNQQSHAPISAPQSAIPAHLNLGSGTLRSHSKPRPVADVFHKLSTQGIQRHKDASTVTDDSHGRPVSALSHNAPNKPQDSFHLPSGMTAEDFSRAVDIVAATASAFKAQQSEPGQPLRRQFSRTSHAQEPSHAQEASHIPHVEQSAVDADAHGGHDAPNWSRTKSASVLMGCTVLYAVIAEILVDVVDVVLDGSGIPEKFLGITLFALVPNTTEFMNAISFALNGNIALSMEIGSAYALQVCLLQIPAMIVFTAFYALSRDEMLHHAFTLVFPRWDVIAILFSVFLLTYVYLEARANYYRGSILIFSYIVLISGFYYAPANFDTEDNPGFQVAAFSSAGLSIWQHLTAIVNSVWTK